jgi:hypothetical protein
VSHRLTAPLRRRPDNPPTKASSKRTACERLSRFGALNISQLNPIEMVMINPDGQAYVKPTHHRHDWRCRADPAIKPVVEEHTMYRQILPTAALASATWSYRESRPTSPRRGAPTQPVPGL